MDKMINSAKFFHTVCKVACGIFNAAMWICGVVAVLVWILPESAFVDSDNLELILSSVRVTIKDSPEQFFLRTRVEVFCIVAGALVLMVIGYLSLRVLQRIFLPMSLGQPFHDTVSRDLKTLAWICLIGGGIYEIINTAQAAILAYRFDTDALPLFNPDIVTSVSFEYTMDFSFALIFAFLMLMSHVFQYGQQLQQLSDETL